MRSLPFTGAIVENLRFYIFILILTVKITVFLRKCSYFLSKSPFLTIYGKKPVVLQAFFPNKVLWRTKPAGLHVFENLTLHFENLNLAFL